MRVVVTVLLALSLPAHAIDPSLSRCVDIDNAAARLACYDEAAGRGLSETAVIEAPAQPSEPAAAAPATLARPTPAPAEAQPAPAPPAQVGPYSEDDFGLEQARADKRGEIVSRLDGEFTGWSGRTLFKLENGQVWRQAETGRFRTSLDRPEITIERGAFGSYRLNVEGLNRSLKVKRVR